MYFGSVRFFKHLIVTVIAALLLLLGIWTIVLAQQNQALRVALAMDSPGPAAGDPAQVALPSSDLPPDAKTPSTPAPLYEALYPALYAAPVGDFLTEDVPTLYLTFDDGPSAYSDEILDLLKARGITATFFVVGSQIPGREATLRRMLDEGHTIGLHSYSHDYHTLYRSVETFLDDFNDVYRAVEDATGTPPTLYRFPGGSINAYNLATYQTICSELLRRGFVYHDWNIAAGDSGQTTVRAIRENVLGGCALYSSGTVLLHETAKTLEALPSILTALEGRNLDSLNDRVKPIVFSYPNPKS